MGAREKIQEIVELDAKIAELKEQFDGLPADERADALEALVDASLADTGAEDPLQMDFGRAVDLLAGLEGDRPARILAKGLDHENPDVRLVCGETLVLIGEEELGRILPAVDLALERGGVMAEEMPFVLIEIEDGEVPALIERFLAHADPEVVASAIEALADLGDPSVAEKIGELVDDKRTVEVAEELGGGKWSLGELAREALEALEDGEED